MDEEIVDILNGSGGVVKQLRKTEAHKTGELHATVIGYLRYGNDWALVRQAADRQDAGQLVAPVGGHVRAHEQLTEALLRESEEEIGTRHINYTFVGKAQFHRQVIGRDENHLFVVYEIATKYKIVLGSEATSLERFSDIELKKALRSNPKEFGDAFYFVCEYFYPTFLPTGYHYRWKTE